MSPLKITHSGSFKNTERFLKNAQRMQAQRLLSKYGERGVSALSSATPRDSGETASSWDYEIEVTRAGYNIAWFNTHVNQGVSIALLIQYGHGTGTGGYVLPNDYINPAMHGIFQTIADDIMKEVSNL